WDSIVQVESKSNLITDLKNRYVELLSKRILSIQPANQTAHYRLGLIYNLTGQSEEAISEMTELVNGKFGECPQANAWMAKELLKQTVAGVQVTSKELMNYLELATKWKDVDFRLISYYAKMLEKLGLTDKAVAVAKQAAHGRPELNLELARLYQRLGYKEELKSAANSAEDIFSKRLNTSSEKESDRLAVAEMRKITDRLEQAAEILSEGLLNKSSGPATKRELSEIQRLMFTKSIFKTDAGVYQADIAMLEKAAETDPLNPNISGEVANLLRLNVKATSNLVTVLRNQIKQGISSASTHIAMAETFFNEGKMKSAISNWEIALDRDPTNLGVLNNLSLSLAKDDEKNIPRSLEMLAKALKLAPQNAELMDTLGDILVIAKRPIEAIAKYDLAVHFDKTRISSRKKLLEVYQANGMQDMADTIQRVIEKMEQEIAEKAKTK
ncbi:MAG TPA: hypothetical protein VM260_25790, partial [Pirellula sp.]|nr:hypothetical protein [Pirellula sp.]